jgi:hypothetical protein
MCRLDCFNVPPEFRGNPLERFEKEARISRAFDTWVSSSDRHSQKNKAPFTVIHERRACGQYLSRMPIF